jgi:hypothetical protein
MGQTRSGEPPEPRPLENLYDSNDATLRERGGYEGRVAESSLYTAATLHTTITNAVATGAALALGAGLAYSILKKKQSH